MLEHRKRKHPLAGESRNLVLVHVMIQIEAYVCLVDKEVKIKLFWIILPDKMVFNVKIYTEMEGHIHIFCIIDEFYEGFVVYLQYHDVFASHGHREVTVWI